jgi:hypothetical protein
MGARGSSHKRFSMLVQSTGRGLSISTYLDFLSCLFLEGGVRGDGGIKDLSFGDQIPSKKFYYIMSKPQIKKNLQ